jgi:hypothetical protein
MHIPHHKFGQTTIAKIKNSDDLRLMLDDPWLESDTIIIKPNWVTNDSSGFTDSKSLRILFEALDSQIIITESYAERWHGDGMSFWIKNKKVNWKWLLKGDGWQWLAENPDWNWYKKGGHWAQIKKEDKVFLDEYGFTDLFKEFNVEYINVTDEVWSGRIVNSIKVKKAVESRFKPVRIEKLYDMVPKKLYDLRGSTFISFAKLKQYASFTIKNLFGMIPDPLRPWWHGPKEIRFVESLLGISKVYHSLFNVYGILEALSYTAVSDPEGKHEMTYGGKYNIVEGLGIVAFGRHLVSLDALLLDLTEGSIIISEKINREPVEKAEEEFGAYDKGMIIDAKKKVGNWFSTVNH